MTLLTAGQISPVAIELLARALVLPRTVTNIPGGEFAGSNGDTITVRVPQPTTAREQTTPGADITFDDTDELPVNVTLAHLYHARLITDEDLSLALVNYARQITLPQVEAVARGAEDQLADIMNGLGADASFAASMSEADTIAALLGAREALTRNGAPSGDRWIAASPEAITRILSTDMFVRADASGSTEALRNAIVGRAFGFTVVESSGLDAGTAVAYHRSGFCFANRVPVIPRGAVDSAVSSSGGIGLRQIFTFIPGKLSDSSVISTFAGAAAVYEDSDASTPADNKRFYKLDSAAS